MQESENSTLNAKQLLDWLMIGSDQEDGLQLDPIELDLDENCPSIANYDIQEKIGDAGQGQVWRAVHLGTRRKVALKLPKYHCYADKKSFQRFVREVNFISGLDHPNIVKILDSGVHRGVYYFTMELIEGKHLDEYVQTMGLSVAEILALFVKVCDAIEFAHNNNVIHRDLKHSNIIISKDGEPHILDFGLAKFNDEDETKLEANTGKSRAGTPAFMSPEQAGGHQEKVSVSSDIYSLGIILFNLLTNEYPFDLSGPKELVLERIALNKVRSLKGYKKIDSELLKIFTHIFQAEPRDRYTSVGELRQDIINYMTNKPLKAGYGSMLYRTGKLFKRNKVAVATSSLAVVVSLLLAGHITYNSKHNFREEFDYPQSIAIADTANWEILHSSKPAAQLIVFNGQLKEAFTTGLNNTVIASDTLTALSPTRLRLNKGNSFISSIDIAFDGYWSEAVGLAFCIQDKDNYYKVELITKTPDKDLLVVQKVSGDKNIELAHKNMFQVDHEHTYNLEVRYDGNKNTISTTLTDTTENKELSGLNSIIDNSYMEGQFGIITNSSKHTFIDNFIIKTRSSID
ncbi:MAG: serine/threonine protein kinase [Sedimentisphaerales bacterium]|nr:serine/threonine protein kinase [Sedimentisphaerales bacterium]